MRLHKDIFIKNEQIKINHLIMQSNERNSVTFRDALTRVNTYYERALNGEGMYNFGEGKFCFDTGFVTDNGEKIVCFCIPNLHVEGQSFCVGFGRASNYGLDLTQAAVKKTNFYDKIVGMLSRIF